MKYVDFYDYDDRKTQELLKSDKLTDRLDGLLYTVLGSYDYSKSDTLIHKFIQSSELPLRNNAYLCIGHLVRIHNKLDLSRYLPLLEEIIQHQRPEFVQNVESAIEDIWIFHPDAKSFDFSPWDCINKYLEIGRAHNQAEKEKAYSEGIQCIASLVKDESNPSILHKAGTSIESLEYMMEDTDTT